jgi:hypothetical protein
MKSVGNRAPGKSPAQAGLGRSTAVGDTARQCLEDLAEAGSATYDRQRHLGGLIALWPEEIADTSAAGRSRVIARLRRALRAERMRGRAGHWTYDLNRHMALVVALKAELAGLGLNSENKLKPDQRGPA